MSYNQEGNNKPDNRDHNLKNRPVDMTLDDPVTKNLMPLVNKREIRIFISSTFRDMMRERDLLVKQVFPELRRIFSRRFITITEVDLRWGITNEQAAEGQVLPLCLAEIERCRPFFISLLGERYGWIPEEIPADLLEREPWLCDYVDSQISVTELEILHGVLNSPGKMGMAFFFFRDPEYINDSSLSFDERCEMVERYIPNDIEKYGWVEASQRIETRKTNLASLKQRIRESDLPLVETYANPEALADIIFQQFKKIFDWLYPESDIPDKLERERMAHASYARNKLFATVERSAGHNALSSFVDCEDHGGRGLVVTGESGIGKTVLLAGWVEKRSVNHPDDFVFSHHFGATPESSQADLFVDRLLNELKGPLGIDEDIPDDPEKKKNMLSTILGSNDSEVKIILVLDGIDQIQGSESERRLKFLPLTIDKNISVFASSLPGKALEALLLKGWSEYTLQPAGKDEIRAMIEHYLAIFARSLETTLLENLVISSGSKNPLYLRTILDEIRQFGSHELLADRIAHYLEANNAKDLLIRVIQRLQSDYEFMQMGEKRSKRIIRTALSLLWASRQGLSEAEWLELLAISMDHRPKASASTLKNDEPQLRLPRALWAPFFLALEPHLINRNGLYTFGHKYLRQAVEEVFFNEPEQSKEAHSALADYFEKHPSHQAISDRKAAELPYQLYCAGEWERLEKTITDIALFMKIFAKKSTWELTRYWQPLIKMGRDMGKCYLMSYYRWLKDKGVDKDYNVPNSLGMFLLDNGQYSAAKVFLKEALLNSQYDKKNDELPGLKIINNLALLYSREGKYKKAEILYQDLVQSRKKLQGVEHPDTLSSISNYAALLKKTGKYEEAERLLSQVIDISEKTLGKDHPKTLNSINILASSMHARGDLKPAESLYRRALRIREKVLGNKHPDTLTSMNNLAVLLMEKKDYSQSEKFILKAIDIQEKVMGPDHPHTLKSICNYAVLLFKKGNYIDAVSLLSRGLDGFERALGKGHHDYRDCFVTLIRLMFKKEDYRSAEPLLNQHLSDLAERMSNDNALLLRYKELLTMYAYCLYKTEDDREEIRKKLLALTNKFKSEQKGIEGSSQYRTPERIKLLIEEMCGDPSKLENILHKLKEEDPELLSELGKWSKKRFSKKNNIK